MAFTDHCDVFASFHEDGFNRILRHVQLQRPSLFNYATQQVADNPGLLCKAIKAHPIVGIRENPLVTIEDPLPIPGTDYGVNFAAQVVSIRVDFHPGDLIPLPRELDPPLKEQRLAFHLEVCAGLGCPPRDIVEQFIPAPATERKRKDERDPVIPIPTRELHCFCLDVYAIGGVRIREYNGLPWLEPFLDDLEIVDIRPEGLENSIECYIYLLLQLGLLPKLRVLLEKAPLEILEDVASIAVKPMPTSAALPHNPAIEEDQLKAFIKVEVV